MIVRILVIAALSMLAGCATPPAPRLVVDSFDYGNDFDLVWRAAVAAVSEMDLPIDRLDKESGLITTLWVDYLGTKNTDVCDCGTIGLNNEAVRAGRYQILVRGAEDRSNVRVLSRFEQTLRESDVVRECVSTGAAEAEINERIHRNLEWFHSDAATGHLGPDLCSPAWYESVENAVGVADAQGHGPDPGSMEWCGAVEFRLGVRDDPDFPEGGTPAWCQEVQKLVQER